ncbi:hypothetical protein J0S82_017027 [Galemys pyrenaicus]|uniref:Uncharacterized protein n=1 Tax=Galemys pyrenaicus TaxID=202257 RepID=A0A8J5ZTE0_GALPY|nr:hypothetical protein J0S82_017027 [Galemys pyrenaicus]
MLLLQRACDAALAVSHGDLALTLRGQFLGLEVFLPPHRQKSAALHLLSRGFAPGWATLMRLLCRQQLWCLQEQKMPVLLFLVPALKGDCWLPIERLPHILWTLNTGRDCEVVRPCTCERVHLFQEQLQRLSSFLALLASSFSFLETWLLVCLSLMISPKCSLTVKVPQASTSEQVKKHGKALLFCLSDDRNIALEEGK